MKDVNLFARKLVLKVLMDKSHLERPNYNDLFRGCTVDDFKALKDIILLMQENQELGDLDSSILSQDIDTLMISSKTVPLKKYKPKSEAFPPLTLNPNIETFTRQVTKDLMKLKFCKNKNENLTPKLRKALKRLQKNKDLIVKPADKGGNIVVQDTKQYRNMCLKILTNTNWYGQSSPLTASRAHEALTRIIMEAFEDDFIDGYTKNYLIKKHPKIPVFYALPKVHKGVIPPPW